MNFIKNILSKQNKKVIMLMLISSLVLVFLVIIFLSISVTNDQSKLNDHQLSIEESKKNISNINDSLDVMSEKINNLKGSLIND